MYCRYCRLTTTRRGVSAGSFVVARALVYSVGMQDYQYKTTPYSHQRKANELAWSRAAYAYLMEMGTGKTKVAIDEMSAMWQAGMIDAAVVLAPKGVYMNWVNNEFPTHMPSDIYDDAGIVEWRAGGGSKGHQEVLRDLLDYETGLPILVMNIEAISSGTHGYLYLTRFLQAYKRIVCYIDESTTIRNHAATRTKRLMELRRYMSYRRIMTGFVAPRSPLDLYGQFSFLDTKILGYTSFFAFRARFAVMKNQWFGGRKVPVVVGYRDVDELGKLIAPHSFRVQKDECLDLPPKVYSVREVELTDEQKRIYQEIRENATATLEASKKCKECGGTGTMRDDLVCTRCGGMGEVPGASVTATAVITQILRLHQVVCGHTNDEEGNSHDIPSNRISELINVLQETDSKTIIWARYRRDIEKIVEAVEAEFGAGSIVEYHGGVSDDRREHALFRFQGRAFDSGEWRDCPAEKQAQFFVGNAQTGGFGLTLTAAKTVVYYSNDYDLEKRLQSEDRAHRSGQTKSVAYVDLVARGTIDEKILKALRAKINISASIMGDDYREWLI
jgi:SNF2 family DNA or RNA helicase